MADDSEISVKVTANADELASGLTKATSEVKDFGDEINSLAQRMAAVKPDAFKELAQQFNAGKVDLDEFRDGLIAVSNTSSAASTEVAALAQSSHLSAGGMRELVVVGRELASGNLTRLPGSLSILATRMGLLSPAGILGAAGIAAVTYAIYEAISSSQQFEAELDKIQNAFTAVGRGDLFDRSAITQYTDDLRQIPGVSEDAANAIINSFARTKNGADNLRELTNDVKPFSELIGKQVPQAAKILAEAFNDPVKGIQALRQEGVELTAAQQQQIGEMMAVNDVAGAQRVLLDAISASMAHVVDTSTGVERFFHNLGNDLRGVNEQATKTREAVDGLALGLRGIQNFSTRNLSTQQWSGSSGSVQATDQAKKSKEDNDAVTLTNQLFDHGNSLLREQEVHKQNILKIQQGINAAESLGDQEAVKRAYADLETENKRYYGDAKQPKDDTDKVEEAQVKAAAEGAEARIKTKQDEVEEEERLGQISSDEAIKQLRELESQEHEVNLKRIADMRSVYSQKGDRAGLASSSGDVDKENERDKQANDKLDSQGMEAAHASQQAEAEGDRRVAEEKIQTAQAAMQEKVALGRMTAQQEIAAEIEAANQKHALDDAYYDSLLAHEQQDSAAYKKTFADKQVAEEKFNQQVLKLRTQLASQSQKQDNELTRSITNGLNQTVSGVLQGTQTMGQAFERMGRNIVISVVEGALDKVVTKFLSNNSTVEAAQTALDSFLGVSNAQNATDSVTTAQIASQGAITAYAGEGAAAAIASTSAIPLVGPELAPAAGAAIYADIMSYEFASAAGGMIVDSDQLAMVHENEMVLPARYTSGLTKMIDGANAGGGGANHFHFSPQINGRLGPEDIDGLHSAFGDYVQKSLRNGQFGGMRRA